MSTLILPGSPELVPASPVPDVVRALRQLYGRFASKRVPHPDTPGLDRETGVQTMYRRDGQPLVRFRFVTADRIGVTVTVDLHEVGDLDYMARSVVRIEKLLQERRRERVLGTPEPKKRLLPKELEESADRFEVDLDELRSWAEEPVEDVKLA